MDLQSPGEATGLQHQQSSSASAAPAHHLPQSHHAGDNALARSRGRPCALGPPHQWGFTRGVSVTRWRTGFWEVSQLGKQVPLDRAMSRGDRATCREHSLPRAWVCFPKLAHSTQTQAQVVPPDASAAPSPPQLQPCVLGARTNVSPIASGMLALLRREERVTCQPPHWGVMGQRDKPVRPDNPCSSSRGG